MKICDANPWIQEVIWGDITFASKVFFSITGFLDHRHLRSARPEQINSFIYSRLPEGKILNALDRQYAETVKSIVFLQTLVDSNGELSINFYAVDINSTASSRSDDAYGVHYLISKTEEYPSIVLFRCDDTLLVSTKQLNQDGSMSFFLSDWISAYDEDYGQLLSLSCINCSSTDNNELLKDFSTISSREQYWTPIPSIRAGYYHLLDSFGPNGYEEAGYYSREDLFEEAESQTDEIVRLIRDEIVELKSEIDVDDYVDMDDLEWELQDLDETLEGEDDGQTDSSVYQTVRFNEPAVEVDEIPDYVLSDPIELLKWMDKQNNEPVPDKEGAIETTEEPSLYHEIRRPAVGELVSHEELGVGIVAHVVGNKFSVEFPTSKRWFSYPGSLERKLLMFLR